MKANCLKCGTEFSFPPSQKRKYCCHACSVKSGSDSPRYSKIESSCKVCGAIIKTKKSHFMKNGQGSYCSMKCQRIGSIDAYKNTWLERRVVKQCKQCGNEVRVKQSHAHKEGSFCSIECRSKWQSINFAGELNPNFKHGSSHCSSYYNSQRRSRDGAWNVEQIEKMRLCQKNRCANCGVPFSKKKMHIDHVMPIALGGNNDINNIQLLCSSCNCRKHAKDPISWAQENGRLL